TPYGQLPLGNSPWATPPGQLRAWATPPGATPPGATPVFANSLWISGPFRARWRATAGHSAANGPPSRDTATQTDKPLSRERATPAQRTARHAVGGPRQPNQRAGQPNERASQPRRPLNRTNRRLLTACACPCCRGCRDWGSAAPAAAVQWPT